MEIDTVTRAKCPPIILSAHILEDIHTTHQLRCQRCSGPCHTECAASATSVSQCSALKGY